MAGQIHKLINTFLNKKANGNVVIENCIKTKLIFKGINPDKFNDASPDDPELIKKVRNAAAEFGVTV